MSIWNFLNSSIVILIHQTIIVMGFSSASMSTIRNNRKLAKGVSGKFGWKSNTLNTSTVETDKLKPEVIKKANKKRLNRTLSYFLPIIIVTIILIAFALRTMN